MAKSSPEQFLAGAPAPLIRRGGGLAVRTGATREERKSVDEMHRQTLAVRAEKIIIAVSQCSVADLAKLTERVGLDLMQYAQATMGQAEATLNPEYLDKFRTFADRSLALGAHVLLEIQALSKENVLDIIADSPSFRELPEERKSWIRRLFGG